MKDWVKRYSRHLILGEIGVEGQQKLSEARVLVVGAGGLGVPVLQYICGAGVGYIGVIDYDVLEISNLQRQVLYDVDQIGQNKAEAAVDKLKKLNPHCTLKAYAHSLDSNNALEIFSKYDLVVDACDNFDTRYLINDAALMVDIPVVFGAIYKFEGQVSVFNHQNGPSYRCLFPEKEQEVQNCDQIGVLGSLPAVVGSLLANEVLKLILGIGKLLSGKLLLYNALSNEFNTITFKANSAIIKEIRSKSKLNSDYKSRVNCQVSAQELDLQGLEELQDKLIIDVSEVQNSYSQIINDKIIKVALRDLESQMQGLDRDQNIALICDFGVKSKIGAEILYKMGFKKLFVVKGALLTF